MRRAPNLFLLLALGVSLFTMLARVLRMLLSVCRMLFALCVIALAVMLRGGAVGLGSIFMMFGCFIVLVSSHDIPPVGMKGKRGKTKREAVWFRTNGPM